MPAARTKKSASSSSKEPVPRGRQYVWVRTDKVAHPTKRGGKTATASTSTSGTPLRASTAPNWNDHPGWVTKKPTRRWARKCVERWCLLPPYDNKITETQWKAYYEERTALEKINTMKSEESAAITPEELIQNTWKVLRKAAGNVAATIFGSKLDDEQLKQRIGRTLMGSLYFTELFGSNEEYNELPPRSLIAKTRLYSPFGIGTSIDLCYDYHYRYRVHMEDERNSSLDGALRTISDCKPDDPSFCAAAPDPENEDEIVAVNGCTIFVGVEDFFRGFVAQSVSEADLGLFEELFFGTKGWISPRKLADLLLAAGMVQHFNEFDVETPEDFKYKFRYFQGENMGRRPLIQERNLLVELEKKYGEEHKGEAVCVPQRLLLLARHEG
ncbi:hypothetical protein CTheo_7948 [Ceratobasidium theobromae]|uniref:Uncharacterized protein n=1 Tax=Ceratobasidium theobromae TaxID=1582974 RepID=A0A5N5QB10_9AGAM|nr:hypothetical protein CTheo_7948 [Ceratobasidium theobromae]